MNRDPLTYSAITLPILAFTPSGLGNYIACMRLTVETLSWSLEFVMCLISNTTPSQTIFSIQSINETWSQIRVGQISSFSSGVAHIRSIRSNLPVAENGRFVIYPAYSGGGTMVANILDFKLSESLKMRSRGSFALPSYL